MSKERPILFSTPMVQAILEGRKTVTRRVVKDTPLQWLEDSKFTPAFVADPGNYLCRYGYSGDILWVRETFGIGEKSGYYYYKANSNYPSTICKWKPSIHMPKTACRLRLKIRELTIERLHNITDQQSIHEGIQSYKDLTGAIRFKDYLSDASGYGDPSVDYPSFPTAKESFKSLWISINGQQSWDSNPWVWVIEFKKVKQ